MVLFLGKGIGKKNNITAGEICFTTSITGYQELLTDPSYAGQIITFTAPHIGNVGCNKNDMESSKAWCRGVILRENPYLNLLITAARNHLMSGL